jgi:probable HAF family extracellular repeat protein
MRDLGTLPGGDYSQATGINAAGQVVGHAITAADHFHAFRWTPTGGMRDLGGLSGEGDVIASGAIAVNARGQVVGYVDFGGVEHAVLWNGQA